MNMQPRLEFEFLRSDPSKIWVKACNDAFAGETEQYINAQLLEEKLKQTPIFNFVLAMVSNYALGSMNN